MNEVTVNINATGFYPFFSCINNNCLTLIVFHNSDNGDTGTSDEREDLRKIFAIKKSRFWNYSSKSALIFWGYAGFCY